MSLNLKKGIDFPGISTAFACHDGNGEFLLSKRSENCRDEQGTWEFGGGSLEHGLSLEENLRKEISEEYSTDVIEYTEIGKLELFRTLADGTKTHWIIFYFKVLIDRKMVKIGEPESIDELGWFTKSNLPTPLHSGASKAIEEFGNKIFS